MNGIRPPQSNPAPRLHGQACGRAQHQFAGFTLIEIAITMAIAAILIVLAAPSFSTMMANIRVKTAAVDLVIAMTKARSEAITRNTNVTVAPVGGAWQNGWTIYPSATPGTILDTHGAVPSSVTISASFGGTGFSVIYQASGRVNPTTTGTVGLAISAAGVITSSGSSSAYRCVSTDLSGRPSIKEAPPCP